MDITLREYKNSDIDQMIEIWNEIVEEGTAFPQTEMLGKKSATEFFAGQTYCAVAELGEETRIGGLYILHPNNIGRCGHIANASFAVASAMRGLHIGQMLVKDCLEQGRKHGFRILQFNAVVKTNHSARHLYEKLGFKQLGTIPGGFLMKNGQYEDICPYYCEL